MKDEQIGKYFSKLMKQHKISREELATKINVSTRQIKKIENGIITCSYETLEKICNEFNITVNQLVMGKEELTRDEGNESFVKIVKYYKDKAKRLYSLMFLIPVILILISIPIFMFMHENRDLAYELNSDSENFKIEHLMFLRDDGYYYLIPGQLTIKNSEITNDSIADVTLMGGDRLIYSSNRYITESSTEKKGYDELFPKEVVSNIDNWYYKITYSINGKEKTDIIKFNVEDLNK
ncbi:MAG: helix-turn-helix transcriptional regulator [Bacilli bacterium]|nr:helix-turn-helix transcriptional regulator [Bacilli bacterium]